jgi:pimeloyl-ACP methyl ester carboxylesterase
MRISRRNLAGLGIAQAMALGLFVSGRAAANAGDSAGCVDRPAPPSEIPELVPPPPPLCGTLGMLDGAASGIWCADSGGEGPAVILLHAHTGTADSWAYQHGVLAEAGYRAIAYSRRGAGLSERADDDRSDVEDLLSVMDALGIERAHMVGIAAGAFVGTAAASEHAERMASLVLCCSIGGMRHAPLQAGTAAILPPEFYNLPAEMREISPSYRMANPDGVARWLAIHDASLSARSALLPEDVRNRMRAAALRGGPTVESVAAAGIPMHLIFGDADLYAPPALARMLAGQLNHPGLSIIPEAGHSANWEMPASFNKALLDFLATR